MIDERDVVTYLWVEKFQQSSVIGKFLMISSVVIRILWKFTLWVVLPVVIIISALRYILS